MHNLESLSTFLTWVFFFLVGMLLSFFYHKTLFNLMLILVSFFGAVFVAIVIFMLVRHLIGNILRFFGFRDVYDDWY